MFHIRKGLDLPLSGHPLPQVDTAPAPAQVAVLGCDFPRLKPTLLVDEGDRVRLGQPLFSDKQNPRI